MYSQRTLCAAPLAHYPENGIFSAAGALGDAYPCPQVKVVAVVVAPPSPDGLTPHPSLLATRAPILGVCAHVVHTFPAASIMENVPYAFVDSVAATIGRVAPGFDPRAFRSHQWSSALATHTARRDVYHVYVQLATSDLSWRYYIRKDPTLSRTQQLLQLENTTFEDFKLMDPKDFQFASLSIQTGPFSLLPDQMPEMEDTVMYEDFLPFILRHSNSWTFKHSLNLSERYRTITEKMLRTVECRPFEQLSLRYAGTATDLFVQFQISQNLAVLELSGFWPPSIKPALAEFVKAPHFRRLEISQECDITLDMCVFETLFERFLKGSAFTKLYVRGYIRAPFLVFEDHRKDMQVSCSPGNEVMWRNPITHLTFLLMENDKGRGYRFIVGKE